MPRQRDVASAGPGRQTACPPPLPDLTGVDLRTLSTMDDPALAAAVDHVLRAPAEFTESWEDGAKGGDVWPRTATRRHGVRIGHPA